jgi:hypothetical protein
MSDYICPVTKKTCKGLCECKVQLKDIPSKCKDKFDAAFRFYKVG